MSSRRKERRRRSGSKSSANTGLHRKNNAQHPQSNPKNTRNRKGQHRRSERHVVENVKLSSAPWGVFDNIFNKLGQAADVCTVVVGYLQSNNEDINGRGACAAALDNYVDEVVREQAARIERIYTGKAFTRMRPEGAGPTMRRASEAPSKERSGGQTDLSEDGQTKEDETRGGGAEKS